MENPPLLYVLVSLGVFLTLIAGCCATSSTSGPTFATTVPTAQSSIATVTHPPVTPTPDLRTTVPQADFSRVAEMIISVSKDTWDADAEYDGVVATLWFQDEKEREVDWEGPTLPVELEIWTTKYVDSKEQKDQRVYSGKGTIDESFGKIRIPFDVMNVPPENMYGLTHAKVTLPDGRTFEAVDRSTALTP